jgi:oxygen-independent coproporphyrinogen-3 oxidase
VAFHVSHGIYIHIPFCPQKCHYCDFNSYPLGSQPTQPYVDALVTEIRSAAPLVKGLPEPFATVFFGGGTPTTLEPTQFRQILSAVRETLPLDVDAEITTEANPGTVDRAKLSGVRESGVNRLSLGVQALDDRLLRTLGRVHDVGRVHDSVEAARAAGFDNLSLDLMFGLPGQSPEDWSATLEGTLSFGVEHLSIYSLIVEPGTAFWSWRERGGLPLPEEEAELGMYELALRRTREEGYSQYEVSNFAKPGRQCRHNLVYWRNEPYLGFGAGAVSYWGGVRRTNVLRPAAYVERVTAGADLVVSSEEATPLQSLGETMMLGLRLLEGVDVREVTNRHGIDPCQQYAGHVSRMTQAGLLALEDHRLRLTPSGLPVANSIWAGFVA